MKKRKSKGKGKFIVLLFVLAALGVSAYFIKTTVFDTRDADEIVQLVAEDDIDVAEGDAVTIFVPDSDIKHLVKKRVYIDKMEIEREKLEAVFYALRDDEDSIIPHKTELKNIFRDGSTLYLNFSNSLYNISKDSSSEMLLIYSIVNTFCSYGGISRVKILINSQEVDTIAGFVNLKDYFERDMLLVQGE